ncbi:MAG: hypothetical protein IKE18_03500 [Oscillospiraceae bacterium]|nr:hypothetical protein [Oscillospiraceae bacterium]
MNLNHKKLIGIILALTLALTVAGYGGNRGTPEEQGFSYAVFFADTPGYIDAEGELHETPSPYMNAECLYVPALTVLEAVGADIRDDTAVISGMEYDISDIVSNEKGAFMSVPSLIERFGLEGRQYGCLAQIGTNLEDLSHKRREELAVLAGYSGHGNMAVPVAEETHETAIDPYLKATYENVCGWVMSLEEEYPGLVTSFLAGHSVEGRDIYGFTLGRGERFIYMEAAIHPSEYVTSNVLAYIAQKYLTGYYEDLCEEGYISYRVLLDNFTFVIIPQVNPDGVNIVQNGFYASTKEVWKYDDQGALYPYQYKANANGVDINRNFPYHWDPMLENGITWPCRRYWCGPEAASEPETQMVINVMRNIPAEAFIDFHKYGETINWIDSETDDVYRQRYEALGTRIALDSGYEDLGTEYIEFGGYAMNYNLHVNDVFGCTVEISRYYPYNEKQLDRIVPTIWRIGLVLGEELLKLDDIKEGLRVEVGGRTVITLDGAAMSDEYISFGQLADIAEKLGGMIDISEDTVTLTIGDRSVSRTCHDEILNDGDVYVSDGEGRTLNLTHLLACFCIDAGTESTTVRIQDRSG